MWSAEVEPVGGGVDGGAGEVEVSLVVDADGCFAAAQRAATILENAVVRAGPQVWSLLCTTGAVVSVSAEADAP